MKRILFAVLSSLVITSAAPIFVGRYSTDAAANTALNGLGAATSPGFGDEIFSAQGRVGNNNDTADTYEIGLHILPNLTNAAPVGTLSERQWKWGNGANTAVNFTFQRTGTTVSLIMGAYNDSWTNAAVDNANTFAFRGRSVNNSSVTLTNLVLNGKSLGQDVNASNGALDVFIYRNIVGDFTLTGTADLDWTTTTAPANSALAFQIKAFEGDAVPEPSTFVIGGLALAGLVAARRRTL